MSSLIPGDLVTDLDLLAIDVRAGTDFGSSSLTEKRRVAVSDWLRPKIEAYGYPSHRHQTRRAPDLAYTLVGSVLASVTTDMADLTVDAVTLSSVYTGASHQSLYLGQRDPYRGVYVAMDETVNAITAASSPTFWNGGAWSAMTSMVDGTQTTVGKSFSGGGRVVWALPETWAPRAIDSEVAYWTRWQLSNTLTADTAVLQMAPIGRSRLTYPAACYALGLLYLEGWSNSRGEWERKGADFLARAEAQLSLVLPLVKDEFDIDDTVDVDRVEVSSLANQQEYLTTWERG